MANRNTYVPDPEFLGRKRFPDDKAFRKQLADRASNILGVLQNLLPSNYSKENVTNLGIWNRGLARESARLNLSVEAVNSDKDYLQTRIQYLQQILGERLFLSDKIAPASYNDESYRDYLISIKNAFLQGSRKAVIEALASHFTGMSVRLKELYLEAREPHSAVSVADTNKMIVEVLVDNALRAGYDIGKLESDLDFFVNLVRPAHVLYDTRLVWTEQIDVNKAANELFGDTGGGCVPLYTFGPLPMPYILAQQVFILPDGTGATGLIETVHTTALSFDLDNGTRVVAVPGISGTRIYDAEGHRTSFYTLLPGQYVRITYQVIEGEFQYYYRPSAVLTPFFESQFYPSAYQSPVFQEFVKKEMDAHGRFPLQIKTTPTTICDRWVQDLLIPQYEDLRKNCMAGTDRSGTLVAELQAHSWYPRLSWPYVRTDVIDTGLLGNNYVLYLSPLPLTDGSSHAAGTADVSVRFDGTSVPLTAVDASTGRVQITDSSTFWHHYPTVGDVFSFGYHYLADGTNHSGSDDKIFGIQYWQMPNAPIVSSDGTLAQTSDIALSVDGIQITNAVGSVRPLLGHVSIKDSTSFWQASELGRNPQIGDSFRFTYRWGDKYQYSEILDDVERPMDYWVGNSPYGVLFDVDSTADAINSPVAPSAVQEIGYRYRAYLLHHSSVLNSPQTLTLNDYQKPATRASIVNQEETLNHLNVLFSAEFLTDKSSVELNDRYLDNGLDPVVKLGPGTPPFQKTYGYQPKLVEERKLQDIRQHHHPLMYSDLLLKEFPVGENTALSSICDHGGTKIGVRFRDEIPPLVECPPWILFDTIGMDTTTITIPGEYIGVPNLRIADRLLRHNFILRDLELTGLASYTYTVRTTDDSTNTTVFYMPHSFPYDIDTQVIDFPALPLMHDTTTYASVADVSVTVDGVSWPVVAVDPLSGRVELQAFPDVQRIETFVTLTQLDVDRACIILPGYPVEPRNITLTVVHGTAQYYNVDYFLNGRRLSWYATGLDGLLAAGDSLRITYDVTQLLNATFAFTYKIRSSVTMQVPDPGETRILDDGYVFGSTCKDGPNVDLAIRFNEYYSGLDDYSEGIKISFFNTSTAAVEQHVFSGPLFELWNTSEDQIGTPGSFPSSLVRLRGPAAGNPLRASTDYRFMEDKLVRYRKKMFKELLPDRTFRTIRITEMLPV